MTSYSLSTFEREVITIQFNLKLDIVIACQPYFCALVLE